MPVTCSFRRKYGYLWLESSDGGEARCDVWSGGNVMALLTYGKQKQLSLFFSDMQHLRNCCKDPKLKGFIRRGEIAMDLPHAKEIAAALEREWMIGGPYGFSSPDSEERIKAFLNKGKK